MTEPARSQPEAERAELKADLDALVAVLVASAAQGGWVVRHDHCFLRIAYDNAVGDRWDRVHRRPAWRCLPVDRLQAAVVVLEQIVAGGPEALAAYNSVSLAHRRRARGSEGS